MSARTGRAVVRVVECMAHNAPRAWDESNEWAPTGWGRNAIQVTGEWTPAWLAEDAHLCEQTEDLAKTRFISDGHVTPVMFTSSHPYPVRLIWSR